MDKITREALLRDAPKAFQHWSAAQWADHAKAIVVEIAARAKAAGKVNGDLIARTGSLLGAMAVLARPNGDRILSIRVEPRRIRSNPWADTPTYTLKGVGVPYSSREHDRILWRASVEAIIESGVQYFDESAEDRIGRMRLAVLNHHLNRTASRPPRPSIQRPIQEVARAALVAIFHGSYPRIKDGELHDAIELIRQDVNAELSDRLWNDLIGTSIGASIRLGTLEAEYAALPPSPYDLTPPPLPE
jgi:hypothetical protein